MEITTPSEKLSFSFIANSPETMNIAKKHGRKMITEKQYEQIMSILYG